MKNTMRQILSFLSLLLALFFAFSAISAASQPQKAASAATIRVSCPLQTGFFEVDENGNYSGYSYEYLMKIAQRTGWRYEFDVYEGTNENLQAGMDQLKNGETDLIVGMVRGDEQEKSYEFPSAAYGVSNFVLMTDEKNEAINERTYSELPNLRVALSESAKHSNSLLDSFCREEGISYQPVYAANADEREQLVKSGQADVLISKDVVKIDGFKTVAKFSPQPFYFAATKGNTQLTEELSRIITEINYADPYYEQRLHEKHFKYESDYQLSFTKDELDYLNTLSSVKVLILKNLAPIESYNPQTGEYSGIIVDLVKKISAQSGMRIEFVPADNMEEAGKLLREGKADVFAGFPYYYPSGEAYGMLLTSPIFSMPVVRVSNISNRSKNEEILVSSSIKLFEGDKNIRYLDDLDEIFTLINNGEYKEAYVNGYLAQRYLEEKNFPNTVVVQTPFSNYDICLGVSRAADLRLISVMEQMISKLKISDVEDIVYKNTAIVYPQSFWDMIRRNPLEFLVPALVLLIIITVLLLGLFFKTKRLNKLISEEKIRYQKISIMDGLAQIYNNDAFKQLAKEYLSITDGAVSGAFIICDIDNFKTINDTYGHLMGDDVIRSLGDLLGTLFRSEDLVGRLGGDEFVMLMKGVTDADRISGRCKEILSRCRTMSEQCEITMSIGIALFQGNVSFDEVFRAADNALYTVKSRGKNGYEFSAETIRRV